MKRLILTLCCLTCLSLAAVTALAQPAPMDPIPAMTAADKPPIPNVIPATMAPAVPSPLPAMTAPMDVPPAMMAPAAMVAPDKPKTATTAPAAAKPIPETKTAKFWLAVVVTPILTMIVALLLAFGVVKKTWVQWLKDKQVYTIVDKVVSNVEALADDGKTDWKDVLAQCLRAAAARLGQLTEADKAKIKAVVEDRKGQANG